MTDQPRRRNPQFAGCLSSVDASTDITANETETKDVRPLSYSQRLINSFLDKDKDTFNMKDIKEQIEEEPDVLEEYQESVIRLKITFSPAQVGNYPPPNIEVEEYWDWKVIKQEKFENDPNYTGEGLDDNNIF